MSPFKDEDFCKGCPRYIEAGVLCSDCDYEDREEDDNEPTEEELEAQRTDAAERKTHAKEVEGEDMV
jgi:hypothetical protein